MTRAAPFGFTKVVFLSHVIDDNTPVFPGDPPVEIHPAATIERNGYYLQSLVAGEQAGTHWAAPAHFNFGHAAADELDPGDFFHPRSCLTSGPRQLKMRTLPLASLRSDIGRRPSGRSPSTAPLSCGRASRTDGRTTWPA